MDINRLKNIFSTAAAMDSPAARQAYPDDPITCLDYISAMGTGGHFIVAITAE